MGISFEHWVKWNEWKSSYKPTTRQALSVNNLRISEAFSLVCDNNGSLLHFLRVFKVSVQWETIIIMTTVFQLRLKHIQ